MPLIVVEMFEGRSSEQKKIIVEGIASVFEDIGVSKDHTHVVIHEFPKQNWASGGILASER